MLHEKIHDHYGTRLGRRGYTVTVPALPGCITQGETIEQCIERAREAIAGYIESLRLDGQPLPEEKE